MRVGLISVCRHAAGHIKSQDDRTLLFGQGYHRLRACQGKSQDCETYQEEYDRNVAA